MAIDSRAPLDLTSAMADVGAEILDEQGVTWDPEYKALSADVAERMSRGNVAIGKMCCECFGLSWFISTDVDIESFFEGVVYDSMSEERLHSRGISYCYRSRGAGRDTERGPI